LTPSIACFLTVNVVEYKLSRDHVQAEELEDELLSLKRDHTKEVQELANKIHVSEEASSMLREESKRLHKDITALIEAKNSLDSEKIDLEATASRLTSELAASLAQIEDANRLALASKSEVSLHESFMSRSVCEMLGPFMMS
jgi:seryl-tRNA synthetase